MGVALEYGDIYFVQRPASPSAQAQDLCIVLRSHQKKNYRLLAINHPQMPAPDAVAERHWVFVERVVNSREEIEKTVGQGRVIANGQYGLVLHKHHTHLAYLLEEPEMLTKEQTELNLQRQTSYLLSVKNPQRPSFRTSGSPQAELPEYLLRKFRDHRFTQVNPPDFLDYEGTELVLTATLDSRTEDLGADFHPIPIPPLFKEAA
jgi:hypothetical protein